MREFDPHVDPITLDLAVPAQFIGSQLFGPVVRAELGLRYREFEAFIAVNLSRLTFARVWVPYYMLLETSHVRVDIVQRNDGVINSQTFRCGGVFTRLGSYEGDGYPALPDVSAAVRQFIALWRIHDE